MDQLKTSAVINGVGLVFDIAGVLVMFQKVNVTTFIYNKGEIDQVNRSKNMRNNFGLFLLLTGFIFQVVALFF